MTPVRSVGDDDNLEFPSVFSRGDSSEPEGVTERGRIRVLLAAAVDLLDQHADAQLIGPDRVNVPTGPDAHIEGVVFDPIPGWHIYVPKDRSEGRLMFVNCPSAMFRSDVVPLSPSDARRLGAALVAAADWVDADTWRRREEGAWLKPT